MTVSCQGVSKGVSPSQSKRSSTTIPFGIASASSSSSRSRSASSSPGTYGSVFAKSQRIPPSIAFAYGSIRSFLELKRCPCSGAQVPWTR